MKSDSGKKIIELERQLLITHRALMILIKTIELHTGNKTIRDACAFLVLDYSNALKGEKSSIMGDDDEG